MTTGRGARIVGVCVVAVVLAAACSGGGSSHSAAGDFSLAAVSRAMRAAGTVRIRISFPASSDKRTTNGYATGSIDFTHDRADIREHPDPAQKNPPLGVTHSVQAHGVQYEQLINEYASMVPAKVSAGKHWLTLPGGNPSSAIDGLAMLRTQDVRIVDRGRARVDGINTRHVRITATKPLPATAAQYVADLYVDGHDRLAREVLVYGSNKVLKIPPTTQQFDYSHYGAPVHIVVPKSSDVVTYSTAVTPTPRLRGPWKEVASDKNAAFSWKLFRAPADIDRECWSFETKPALRDSQSRGADLALVAKGTKPLPRHNGHTAVCSRTGDWQSEMQVIAQLSKGTSHVIVAVLRDDVAKVEDRAASDSFPPGGTLISPGPSYPTFLTPPSAEPTRIPIDARFHGFVYLQPRNGGSYRVFKRDGSYISCEGGVGIIQPGAPTDTCVSPF